MTFQFSESHVYPIIMRNNAFLKVGNEMFPECFSACKHDPFHVEENLIFHSLWNDFRILTILTIGNFAFAEQFASTENAILNEEFTNWFLDFWKSWERLSLWMTFWNQFQDQETNDYLSCDHGEDRHCSTADVNVSDPALGCTQTKQSTMWCRNKHKYAFSLG